MRYASCRGRQEARLIIPPGKESELATRMKSGALAGIEGLAVTVEVDISRGLPGFHLVGLPNAEVKESRDRVLAALRNTGIRIPPGKITVNLAPAGIRKEGASYDLAIAVGIMAAAGAEASSWPDARRRALFLGELSLFGELRPVRGLLPIVLAACRRGEKLVVVPGSQVAEASLVAGVQAIGADDLGQVLRWCRTGNKPPQERTVSRPGDQAAGEFSCAADPWRLLVDLQGQSLARKAAVLAATGGHNLLLIGPPGTGKTRLARILARLQSPLTPAEGMEVTLIHSAAGLLQSPVLLRRRPFRAPHHTITRAGLIGGGPGLRPGEVTMAHRGILFLDELAEFSPAVLDVLREPLEEGTISVVRGGGHRTFPADFQLIAAMNPCRCGHLGSVGRRCRCSPSQQRRYLRRLSGPLLDRFDLFVEMDSWQGNFLSPGPLPAGPDVCWRRLPSARQVARARHILVSTASEGASTSEGERAALRLTRPAREKLEEVRRALGLSLRGVNRCARVARTLAALDGREDTAASHVQEALEFRLENISLSQNNA